MTPDIDPNDIVFDFDWSEDVLAADREHRRRYEDRLRAHPDCSDPDHPGCEDCEEFDE